MWSLPGRERVVVQHHTLLQPIVLRLGLVHSRRAHIMEECLRRTAPATLCGHQEPACKVAPYSEGSGAGHGAVSCLTQKTLRSGGAVFQPAPTSKNWPSNFSSCDARRGGIVVRCHVWHRLISAFAYKVCALRTHQPVLARLVRDLHVEPYKRLVLRLEEIELEPPVALERVEEVDVAELWAQRGEYYQLGVLSPVRGLPAASAAAPARAAESVRQARRRSWHSGWPAAHPREDAQLCRGSVGRSTATHAARRSAPDEARAATDFRCRRGARRGW
eukprot:SAG11_NODE_186_length_13142_cov_17.515679_3_plen_275_part_00